jgi:hypothetical protein
MRTDNIAEDEIYCSNLRYAGSRPGPAVGSAVEDEIMKGGGSGF